MKLQQVIAAAPAGLEIVLADVGSAGGIKGRWAPARPIVSALLFEPRDGGEPRRVGRDTLYPVALGPAPGRATLNLTALPNMSSALEPNSQLLQGFLKKGAHTEITGTLEMPVDTLDAIAQRGGHRIDAVKIDTQGSELVILRGAEACLQTSIFLAEIEVSFLERYRGQPLLRDIETFMGDHGFELIDLYRLKRYRRKNGLGVANVSLGGGQRAGRLAYGDALFVRREERLLPDVDAGGADLALKVIVSLLVYGKADMAATLFERTQGMFDSQLRRRLQRFFRSLGRQFFRHNSLHHLFDYFSRNV